MYEQKGDLERAIADHEESYKQSPNPELLDKVRTLRSTIQASIGNGPSVVQPTTASPPEKREQTVADTGRRVALVIGNGAYRNVTQLPNPRNDANDIAASLKRLNFSVNKVIDGTFDDMRRALLQFGRDAIGLTWL